MRHPDTSMGGDLRDFPTTPGVVTWSDALEDLSRVYWKPVYLFMRTVWRCSNEDAKDLAQQFFLHLLKHQSIERYQPAKAPFRVYIKICLRNFLVDEHRRRETQAVPLAHDVEAETDADVQFERAWLQTVLDEAIAELRREVAPVAWAVFEAYDLRPADQPKSTYAELGRAHGMTEGEVRQTLANVRGILRAKAIAQVRRSVSDPDELCSELGHLGFL